MDENSQGSKGATHIVADGNVYPNPFFAVIEADHKKLHLCKLIIYVYKKITIYIQSAESDRANCTQA
jgi:hypothetical protein